MPDLRAGVRVGLLRPYSARPAPGADSPRRGGRDVPLGRPPTTVARIAPDRRMGIRPDPAAMAARRAGDVRGPRAALAGRMTPTRGPTAGPSARNALRARSAGPAPRASG